MTALLTDVVAAVLLTDGDQSVAYVAGELMVPLVAVGGLVGGLAMAFRSRWQPWYAVPLVAVIGVGLHLGQVAVESALSTSGRTPRRPAVPPRVRSPRRPRTPARRATLRSRTG